MIDIELVQKKFEKSINSYNDHAIAQRQIAQKLYSLLSPYLAKSSLLGRVLEVGCGTGFLTHHILQHYPSIYFLNDINKHLEEVLQPLLRNQVYEYRIGDAEQIELPKELDLLVSSSCIQWFENLPSFINKINQSLNNNAYVFLSTFRPSNMREIRQITGVGLPYYSLVDLQILFQQKYEILFLQEEFITLSFNSVLDVLNHLKQTGVNGGFSRVWTKKAFMDFCVKYECLSENKNKIQLTYHPIYIGLKKR